MLYYPYSKGSILIPDKQKKQKIKELKLVRQQLQQLRTTLGRKTKLLGIRNKREKLALVNIAEENIDRSIAALSTDNYDKMYELSREYKILAEQEFSIVFDDPKDGYILVKSWFIRLASLSITVNLVLLGILALFCTLKLIL
jgi:hypothetical protein